jgi:hypothetical protein
VFYCAKVADSVSVCEIESFQAEEQSSQKETLRSVAPSKLRHLLARASDDE